MRIYVGNMSYETNETELRAAFAAFGQVTEVRLITDRDTGRPKGFAFVEMANNTEAETAIQALNGKPLQGRDVVVNEARPRETNQRSGSGGSGGSGYGGGDRMGGGSRRY